MSDTSSAHTGYYYKETPVNPSKAMLADTTYPTPRTNVAQMQCHSAVAVEHAYMRMCEHAEQLERELASVTEECRLAHLRCAQLGGVNDMWVAAEREVSKVRCELATVTAQQDALIKEHAWQPIETAPKDGTSIIVLSETGNVWCNVKWCVRVRAGERWEHFTLGGLRFLPTHWMPMPKAPEVAP